MSGSSVLSRVRARVYSGYPTPELDDMRMMLEAVEGVLELQPRMVDSIRQQGYIAAMRDVHWIISAALGGDSDG